MLIASYLDKSTGLQSLNLGNWWRLLELLCWSKTLRGNLTAPVPCFWKLGKTFSLCWLVLVPESSSAGGWTRRRRYGEKTMRLLADVIMAVKLRLKSRITNLCTSILLVNWSVAGLADYISVDDTNGGGIPEQLGKGLGLGPGCSLCIQSTRQWMERKLWLLVRIPNLMGHFGSVPSFWFVICKPK